jgi:sulfur-carrier protein
LKLLYFAWVRQKTGKSGEILALSPDVDSVSALVAHLAKRGGGYAEAFAEPARLKAAVNWEHARFDAPVCDEDEVAFFPPMTGG